MAEGLRLAFAMQRRALAFWAVGLGAFALLSLLAYPATTGNGVLARWWDGLPAALRAVFGGLDEVDDLAGYLEGRLFAVLPVLLAIHVVIAAMRALAGQEEDRTIDVVLGLAGGRARHVLASAVAIGASATAIALVMAFSLLLGAFATGADVDLLDLVIATLQVLPLVFVLGAVALLASAILHAPRAVLAVGFGFVLLAYIVHAAGVGPFSLVGHYEGSSPLTGSLDLRYMVGHVGGAAVLVGVATWAYGHKDLR